MAHMYDVGTKAWQPDPAEGWIASEVTEKKVDGDTVRLVFALENGEVRLDDAHNRLGCADGRRRNQSRRRSRRCVTRARMLTAPPSPR